MEGQESNLEEISDVEEEEENDDYTYSDDELEYEKEYFTAMQQLSGPPVQTPAPVQQFATSVQQYVQPTKRGKNEPKPTLMQFGGVINLEIVGEGRFGKLVLSDPTASLDPYYTYIATLKGKQVGPRQWEYPLSKETAVKNLLTRIVTGQLLPPSYTTQVQLPTTNINVGMAMDTPEDPNLAKTVIVETPNIQQVAPPVTKSRVRPPVAPAVTTPTGTSVSAAQLVQSQMNPVPRPQGVPAVPKDLPKYDPTVQELGESEERYKIRLANYNKLIGYGQQAADLLSRVRNNVDFDGVDYSATMMQYINAYLPK